MRVSHMTLAVACAAFVFAAPAVHADTPRELANRRIVLEFYEKVFNAKDFAAASQFLGPRYVEHDPSMADGHDGLKAHVSLLKEEYPQSRREIKRVIAEGDHVILHVHSMRMPGARGEALAHIYRLENGRIVEHWSMTQAVPEAPHPKNPHSMF